MADEKTVIKKETETDGKIPASADASLKDQSPQAQTTAQPQAEQAPARPDKKTIQAAKHEFELAIGECVIAKGESTIKVSKRNYESVYKNSGWQIVDEKTKEDQKKS